MTKQITKRVLSCWDCPLTSLSEEDKEARVYCGHPDLPTVKEVFSCYTKKRPSPKWCMLRKQKLILKGW